MSHLADGGGGSDGVPVGASHSRSTRVASHAQKYFLRDSAANQIRKRQRPSIHDIRSSSSVPSTQLEQEQLKSSLQRINKQSMELEMNAASDFHAGAFGYASAPQSQTGVPGEDPTQSAVFQAHFPLSQDIEKMAQGGAPSFWPTGQSESQILAQNVLRGLLNSPFQLTDLNPITHGQNERALAAASARAGNFASQAVTAPAAGVPTSFAPSDVFGDMSELAGVNSKVSPRAFALAGRHPTSDPNPMGNFSRQPPCSMGGPGTPGGPLAVAQSALLSQQLHAAAGGNSEDGVATGAAAHPQQRVWSVADMATSLGLERLYQQGEQQGQVQSPADAVYGPADRQHSHSSLPGATNTANALRSSSGLSAHLSPQAQAVARLASQDRVQGAQQRVSVGGEDPNSNGAAAAVAAHRLQMPPAGPQGAFAVGASAAPGAPADPTQLGAAGNDPFLQLLQGLKVAKALQGAGETEEPQHQDAHYRALVQMLAQRNAQAPPESIPGNAAAPSNAAPAAGLHAPGSQEPVLGPASRGLNNAFDVHRLNTKVGSQGTIAGLEDMHALASLVAHSTGMPAARVGGSQDAYTGLVGGLGIDPSHRSVAAAGAEIAPPAQVSPAPPPAFHGGNGATWDVGSKQLQDMSPQFHEALSRLQASSPGGGQWPNTAASGHTSNPQ